MHSSEFLKYAYELGAAQALADFEKDAGFKELLRKFNTGLAGTKDAVNTGVLSTFGHPTVAAGMRGFVSGMGAHPSSLSGAMIGGALGTAKELAPIALNRTSWGAKAVSPLQALLQITNVVV